jgi:hypothetical protein
MVSDTLPEKSVADVEARALGAEPVVWHRAAGAPASKQPIRRAKFTRRAGI